jgi:ring-1,2-phenylacetyl-CoA epoxidase subunit PaaD
VTVAEGREIARAERAVAAVVDPELPMLTLADLGVVRSVDFEDRRVVVTVTPTYTGCPATATIRTDLRLALAAAGFPDAEVRVQLAPPWSSDLITARGRAALRAHGIAPPGRVVEGPVDLVLEDRPPAPACPRCGSRSTRELARFGATPCTSLHVCAGCREPFDKVKEL